MPINRVIAIYARENGQGMAFPVGVSSGAVGEDTSRSSPLSSVSAAGGHNGDEDSKVIQIAAPDPSAQDAEPDGEPPRPPNGPRPALKRVK